MQNYILPVVLYGRETWSHTQRKERIRTAFVNKVPRKIFGPTKDTMVTGEGS
jgi:hypothetical protein